MIAEHLPALQVVVPLIAAPLCVLLRGRDWAWAAATLVAWATFGISCLLLERVLAEGVISYHLGGWAPPWGIEYRLDAVNGFVLLIVAAIGAVTLPFARQSVLAEFGRDRDYLFYSALLLCLTGLLGVTITGDAFNLFVFLEISSLSSYILISTGRHRRALHAAFQYLVLGTIGATFIVIAIGLLYETTGTLNMADIAARVHTVGAPRTVKVAFAFFTVGVCLKLALFPLHIWLPNAYAYAPSVVSAFLAATATKVALYALLRVCFTIFGVEFSFGQMPLGEILLVLALCGMFVAAIVAIFQDDVKRMLAYSSVSQIGYMILGVSFASVTGLTSGIIHLFNHAMIKGGLFLVMGCIAYRIGSVRIDRMDGLGKRMPWTMAAFVAGGLGLIGVPLTVGFVSKWYLVLAALEKGWWPVAALVVACSLIAVVYVWRVVEHAYFRDAPVLARAAGAAPNLDAPGEAPLSLLAPAWVLIGASIWFGIDADFTAGVAHRAAATLLGVAP